MDKIELLRAAIAAKQAYWAANGALEKAFAAGGDIDDDFADEIHVEIEEMSIGPDAAVICVGDLADCITRLELKATGQSD